MDKVRLATDERVDLVDALRLGSLTEDALMQLVQVFFGQTDSGYTTLSSDEAVTTPIMPVIWEPVQIATATQTALPIDISTNPATLTLELRKSGSRQARIWAGDGNQISGANASGTVAFSVTAGTASGIYYIKVRRKETENRGFPGASESRMYISRSTQQESGAATNTKLLDEWEVSTALSTSAAPSGRYFSVAAFEVALSGGVQKVVAITNLAGSTTGSFSAAPASFAWKRARTHAWSSRTTAAQDSFRTLKDVYDAITTAISEMRDGQLWLVDPATQAKFDSGGGLKLSNGARLAPSGTGSFSWLDNTGQQLALLSNLGSLQLRYLDGATVRVYFEVKDDAATGTATWKCVDTTRTLRIQTARANATGNVPMEQRWPVAGVPAPNTYLDRYLTTTAAAAEREHARINAWTGHWESPHAVIDDDFIGPLSVNIGNRQTLVWNREDVLGSLTDSELQFAGRRDDNSTRWVAPRAGSVTAVSIKASDAGAIAGGGYTVKIRKGTTEIVIVVTNSTALNSYVTYPRQKLVFAAGDEINVTVTTGVGFSPTTTDLAVAVEISDSDTTSFWDILPSNLADGLVGDPLLGKELATSGAHGVVRIQTGANANDKLTVVPTAYTTELLLETNARLVYKARLRVSASATNSITLAIGLYRNSSSNAMFRFGKGASPANSNWYAILNTDDTLDTEDLGTSTGVAAATAAFQNVEIWVDPASTTFLIEGTIVATLAGLTGTGAIYPRLRIKTLTGAARAAFLDYVRVYATRGAL